MLRTDGRRGGRRASRTHRRLLSEWVGILVGIVGRRSRAEQAFDAGESLVHLRVRGDQLLQRVPGGGIRCPDGREPFGSCG
jgi:hypothetical protein